METSCGTSCCRSGEGCGGIPGPTTTVRSVRGSALGLECHPPFTRKDPRTPRPTGRRTDRQDSGSGCPHSALRPRQGAPPSIPVGDPLGAAVRPPPPRRRLRGGQAHWGSLTRWVTSLPAMHLQVDSPRKQRRAGPMRLDRDLPRGGWRGRFESPPDSVE